MLFKILIEFLLARYRHTQLSFPGVSPRCLQWARLGHVEAGSHPCLPYEYKEPKDLGEHCCLPGHSQETEVQSWSWTWNPGSPIGAVGSLLMDQMINNEYQSTLEGQTGMLLKIV